ncbi:DUF6929 family protein [Oligoflexus tunisiensis]|uniref:DUF6929 family protein n=1 Tax=Oligoflexus tunisiensis TaxID=708132 RepID=UPI001C4082A8|nr:hypothetical protein [Oligoflexus tunisiensis]
MSLPLVFSHGACSNISAHSGMLAGPTQETIDCTLAETEDGIYRSLARHPMGPKPRTTPLADESSPGSTHLNPVPEDADSFLRAASGVRIARQGTDDSFAILVAQDSRRKIGLATYGMTLQALETEPQKATGLDAPSIGAIPVDTPENIAAWEDDRRDYDSYRKKYKRDFEAMTTMPDGTILVLASGSDIVKYQASGVSYRSQALVLSSAGHLLKAYDLLPFYLHMQRNRSLIGEDTAMGPAEINFEGVTIRPEDSGFVIGFYHRGNINGNGHNALIEFDFAAWYHTLQAAQQLDLEEASALWLKLEPLRTVRIRTPRVTSPADPAATPFPMTLNDALFGFVKGRGTVLIPVAVEAEYKNAQGVQEDGAVIFSGLLVWENMDQPGHGTCTIHQAPGDDEPGKLSKFGKVEGLAAYHKKGTDLYEQSLYSEHSLLIGVTDVDSEIEPSTLSFLQVGGT